MYIRCNLILQECSNELCPLIYVKNVFSTMSSSLFAFYESFVYALVHCTYKIRVLEITFYFSMIFIRVTEFVYTDKLMNVNQ